MPEMLTVDERFEAIIADAIPAARMNPLREPDPEQRTPVEQKPAESAPEQEKPSQEE
ncbi:hypothetical protein ACIRPH_29865 [Nocardiopsis sp. NPDC101807]|uniref:hypothetical protein n=1 Tax=Nocardiopsis sp. NPDC101807 TaxID=3364339 RepID=UPI003825C9BC